MENIFVGNERTKTMKVRVVIQETKVIERTYEIDGVNSIDSAKKCAERCYFHQFQPNAYMMREVPRRSTISFGSVEVVNP